MFVIIIWAVGAVLLLINIILRTRILRLEAELKKLRAPHEYTAYLHQQNAAGNKAAAIKALRKQYPEVTLVEANRLYQNL